MSSIAGQIVDSVIFVSVAFIGVMNTMDIFMLLITEITLKTAYEIFVLPLTNIVVKKVFEYERRSELNG